MKLEKIVSHNSVIHTRLCKNGILHNILHLTFIHLFIKYLLYTTGSILQQLWPGQHYVLGRSLRIQSTQCYSVRHKLAVYTVGLSIDLKGGCTGLSSPSISTNPGNDPIGTPHCLFIMEFYYNDVFQNYIRMMIFVAMYASILEWDSQVGR